MNNGLFRRYFLGKLEKLASSIKENILISCISERGAIKGIPPMEFNDSYQQPQKTYKEEKFDKRSEIYGTKRRNTTR